MVTIAWDPASVTSGTYTDSKGTKYQWKLSGYDVEHSVNAAPTVHRLPIVSSWMFDSGAVNTNHCLRVRARAVYEGPDVPSGPALVEVAKLFIRAPKIVPPPPPWDGMPPAKVQGMSAWTSAVDLGATFESVMTLNGVTSGNALIVFATFKGAQRSLAVQDNVVGATGWTRANQFTGSSTLSEIWFNANHPGGDVTISVTHTLGTGGYVTHAEEWSGFGTAITVEAYANNSETANTHYGAPSPGISSPNPAVSFVTGYLGSTAGVGDMVAGTGYTEIPTKTGITPNAFAEYRVFTTAVTDERGEWSNTGTARQGLTVMVLLSGNAGGSSPQSVTATSGNFSITAPSAGRTAGSVSRSATASVLSFVAPTAARVLVPVPRVATSGQLSMVAPTPAVLPGIVSRTATPAVFALIAPTPSRAPGIVSRTSTAALFALIAPTAATGSTIPPSSRTALAAELDLIAPEAERTLGGILRTATAAELDLIAPVPSTTTFTLRNATAGILELVNPSSTLLPGVILRASSPAVLDLLAGEAERLTGGAVVPVPAVLELVAPTAGRLPGLTSRVATSAHLELLAPTAARLPGSRTATATAAVLQLFAPSAVAAQGAILRTASPAVLALLSPNATSLTSASRVATPALLALFAPEAERTLAAAIRSATAARLQLVAPSIVQIKLYAEFARLFERRAGSSVVTRDASSVVLLTRRLDTLSSRETPSVIFAPRRGAVIVEAK